MFRRLVHIIVKRQHAKDDIKIFVANKMDVKQTKSNSIIYMLHQTITKNTTISIHDTCKSDISLPYTVLHEPLALMWN